MFGFVKGLLQLLKSILNSLLGTLSDLATALRMRSGSKAFSLLREGSPLESFVDSLLSLVFWIVVLTPFVLFPVVYLFMALMK